MSNNLSWGRHNYCLISVSDIYRFSPCLQYIRAQTLNILNTNLKLSFYMHWNDSVFGTQLYWPSRAGLLEQENGIENQKFFLYWQCTTDRMSSFHYLPETEKFRAANPYSTESGQSWDCDRSTGCSGHLQSTYRGKGKAGITISQVQCKLWSLGDASENSSELGHKESRAEQGEAVGIYHFPAMQHLFFSFDDTTSLLNKSALASPSQG